MSRETPPTTLTTSGVHGKNRSKTVIDKDLQVISEQLLHLLGTAPRTLCSVGECYAIAWSDGVDNITQTKDPELSKFLRTNLVECTDLGRDTFREAEDRMGRISFTIRNIIESGGVIDKILGCLKETDPSSSELGELFDDMERFANECVEDSKLVAKRTQEWQKLVTKMNKAFSTADGVPPSVNSAGKAVTAIPLKGETRNCLFLFWLVLNKLRDMCSWKKETRAVATSPEASPEQRVEEQQQGDQEGFDEIVRELEDIASKNAATHEQVSRILWNCQKNMGELDTGTESLCGFFNTLHALTGSMLENIRSVESATPPAKLSREQVANLGTCTNKLYIYYTIAGDTSSTFAEVSRRYIIPGINKVDSLSSTKTKRGDIEEMIKGIAHYSKEAQKGIRDLVEERRRRLEEKLFDTGRVQEISEAGGA